MQVLKKYKTGIVLALCISFLLTVYAPLELYIFNDFWFDFSTLLPFCLVLFLISWGMGGCFFCLLGRVGQKPYKVALFIAFLGLVCTYIQGTFLIKHLPPTDGSDIDWSEYWVEDVKTLLLWVIVCGLLFVLFKVLKGKRFYRLVEGSCLFLAATLFVSIISLVLMKESYKSKDMLVATNKDEFEYSSDTNFVILVLDAVDAGTVSELMRSNPEIQDIFDDFTYYENTMGAYPCTQFSLPFILSGEWYLNDGAKVRYFRRAINNSAFIQSMESQYKMGIYSDSIPVVREGNEDRFVNMVTDGDYINSYSLFAEGIIKMAGFRYAPFPLKRWCYDVVQHMNDVHGLGKQAAEDEIFSWDNRQFYEELETEQFTVTDDKVFKLIHLEGAHVPFRYNKDVEYVEDGTYQGNVEASITIASRYLDKLKENGVYDNAVIIIMADHGYVNEITTGRQNPMLFVKGIGEQHTLKISEAPISYEDLQNAYQKLLSGENGDQIFDYEEGDVRQRRYILYDYLKEAYMYEYMSTGHARETDELTFTGNQYVRN